MIDLARAAAVVAILLAVTSAAADPADDLAAEGKALFDKAEYRAAAEKFAAAYKADPKRPELFCNIGISYYKAEELPRAHLLLGRCLERATLEAKFMENARAVITSVEQTLRAGGHTPVTVEVVPSATSVRIPELYADEAFVGTRVVWLPFGTFHLQVHAEGYRDQTVEVVTAKADPQTVSIALERAETPPPPPPVRRAGPRPSKLPAILATAGTAVAAGVATLGYLKAHDAADLAHIAIDDTTFRDDEQSVKRWNTVFGIGGALTIAGAGVAGYLWYRALSAPRLELDASTQHAAVSIRARF